MSYVPAQLALCMLLLSSLRFGMLIREELRQYRESRNLKAFIPSDGSLQGIGANGEMKIPNADRDEHLLIFVLHRESITGDIQFWNHVVELTSRSLLRPDRPIQYWGICDEGGACDSSQSLAHFSILGYLDPYQMHVIAKADAQHEVLLYGRSMALNARIAVAADPSTESNLILGHVK